MSSTIVAAATLLCYFLLLLLIARLTSGAVDSNDAFFRGNRKSPWYLVAFGMIGASMSGVSFVSVPGYVGYTQMTYLQMCMGFFCGYLVVAFVLLPIYYQMNLTSIYTYLQNRFGGMSRRTGASFFFISKMAGAAIRFYLVCIVLQQFLFSPLGIPFPVTVVVILLMVWLYTRRAGIRTLVYTDTLQTLCFIGATIAVLVMVYSQMPSVINGFLDQPLCKVFEWEDWNSKQFFGKQFLSGIFIVVVMTGLDQDMMQKNLTCKTLQQAQKNMCSYGICFIPVNFLLLSLGVMLYAFAEQSHIPLPQRGDEMFPLLVQQGHFGTIVTILFILGISSAAFSSVDSALTALTTTFCVDILGLDNGDESKTSIHVRKRTHLVIICVFVMLTLLFKWIGSNSVLDTIYTVASYTYGPLLGLFAFGIFTSYQISERFVPVIAFVAPILCYGISEAMSEYTNYHMGYELLLLNGAFTFAMLRLCVRR